MWLPLGITESFSTAEPSLQIEAVIAFVEGPAWHPSGDVFFSDIANSRIRDRTASRSTIRTDSGSRLDSVLENPRSKPQNPTAREFM